VLTNDQNTSSVAIKCLALKCATANGQLNYLDI